MSHPMLHVQSENEVEMGKMVKTSEDSECCLDPSKYLRQWLLPKNSFKSKC